MLSVKSLEPIKKAVASQDRVLLDALVQALDNEDFRAYAEGMVMASSPPAKEPGCWNYLVRPLAEHFGLSPELLPLDDWKHYAVWEDYRALVDPLVSEPARALLKFLEAGRPFVGTSVTHDGCVFAWLSAAETKSLLAELEPLDAEEFGELDEFHEELVECLRETADRDSELFLGAS
jgi:hypothetical protein